MARGRPPLWASALGGLGAGVAVAVFLVAPWPWGLAAMPALPVWAWLLSARGRPTLLVLVGAITLVLAVGTGFLLGGLG